jgi:hypothetical protein
MTEARFKNLFPYYAKRLFLDMQAQAAQSAGHNYVPGRLPFDTGNMANSALKFRYIDKEHYQIYIDGTIAPYATTVNDNYYTEGFWESFAREIAYRIKTEWSDGGK